MGWKIYQITFVTAVLFGNVHWEWTDNWYAASIGAGILAWYSSAILFYLYEKMFVPESERLTPPSSSPRYSPLEIFKKERA